MIKKITIIAILIFFISLFPLYVNAVEPVKPGRINDDLYQTSIITMLDNDIAKAINEYYGNELRGYDLFDASIINISRPAGLGWGTHDIVIQVYTFEGAHNPPNGTEIMTFRIGIGKQPKLIDYRHKNGY